MVAFAPITNTTGTWDVLNAFPKLHSRAREAKTDSCTEAPHSKSFGRVEIWLTIYDDCDGLESFTRDPIEYADGHNLAAYVGSNPMLLIDPSGNTAVRITKKHAELPRKCGSTQFVQWAFSLITRGDKKGPCNNGYEGYLVQFVEQWCLSAKCKECRCPDKPYTNFNDWYLNEGFLDDEFPAGESFSYFEAWEVTKNGDVQDLAGYTDRAAAVAKDDTCGYANQNGTVRYYCKEDVNLDGWHPGGGKGVPNKFYGTSCPTTPGSLPSVGGDSPPGFWIQKSPIAEAPKENENGGPLASRFLHVDWSCCQKNRWVNASYKPD